MIRYGVFKKFSPYWTGHFNYRFEKHHYSNKIRSNLKGIHQFIFFVV